MARLLAASVIGLLTIIGASDSKAVAMGTLQFGLVFPSVVEYPAPVPPGTGISWSTFVILNVGDVPFRLADLSFSVTLGATNLPINPILRTANSSYPDDWLMPGHGVGSDIDRPGFDAATILAAFPTVTELSGDTPIAAMVTNPSEGVRVTFGDSETLLHFTLGLASGAVASFDTVFKTAAIQYSSQTIVYADSMYSTAVQAPIPEVPEPSTGLLLLAGVLSLVATMPRRTNAQIS